MTPRFQPVIDAEKIREEATREACSIRNAISILRESVATAKVQLAELQQSFPGILARRALLQIKESEVTKARDAMAACARTINEGAMALPVLEEGPSRNESSEALRAERILGLSEKYSQLKSFLLAETYSGSVTFITGWKLLQTLAAELGPEAVQDRDSFVQGLKAIRPKDFW